MMAGLVIRKAERRKTKLRLALCGPTGSGKSLSALLLAFGLGGKVGVVDTENGSADLYAERGDYDVITLAAPYTVTKYREAIRAFEEANYDIIIIDSLSHAWSGEGGLLDKQGQLEKSGRFKNSFATWREITPEHNKLVEELLNSPAHIVATMRVKTEYVLEVNEKGKQVPRKIGLSPVQRDGVEYEFSIVMDISDNHYACASKDRTSLFDGWSDRISSETGKMLARWLDSGAQPTPVQSPQHEEPLTPFDVEPMDALRGRVSAVIQTLDKQRDIASVEKVMRLAQGLLVDCDATDGAADLKTRLMDAFDAARERVEPSDAAEPQSMEMGMPE